jgi:hypothetical protein
MRFKLDLAMAVLAAGLAPRVRIQNGKLLGSTLRERIIEFGFVRAWRNPHILGISKEHAQKVATAALSVTVGRPSMHHTHIIDVLNVTVASVKLDREPLRHGFDDLHSMDLLGRDFGHRTMSWQTRSTKQRCFYQLTNGLAFGEKEYWFELKGRRRVPIEELVQICERFRCSLLTSASTRMAS